MICSTRSTRCSRPTRRTSSAPTCRRAASSAGRSGAGRRSSPPASLRRVQIPTFSPHDDPGPDFAALLRAQGRAVAAPEGPVSMAGAVPHGTTVVAIRYADGVVMAGDRRATSGHLISHRTIEKVFPADRWSGVAIAGCGWSGHGDGQAVPAAARALREGRGAAALARWQGQPALADGAQPPARRHAGARRGAPVRRL
jgi:hypothetical protein